MPGQDHDRSRRCKFAEALARGEKDRWDIIKTVLEDKVREVI